jgi:hypothetical protein
MPDPKDPSEPKPDEEEHGGGLVKTLREIEDEPPLEKPHERRSTDET